MIVEFFLNDLHDHQKKQCNFVRSYFNYSYTPNVQMEIDEFRDYEKALDALKESKQQLEKAKKLIDRECRIDVLESRIAIVTDFVQARKYEKSDPHKMADMCTAILSRREATTVGICVASPD